MGIRAAIEHYWGQIEDLTPPSAGSGFVCAERAGEGVGVELENIRNRSRVFELLAELQADGRQAMFTGAQRVAGTLALRVLYDAAVPKSERRVIQSEDLNALMALFADPAIYLSGTTLTIAPIDQPPTRTEVTGDGGRVVSEIVEIRLKHIYRESV